jgi:hypothetical protein
VRYAVIPPIGGSHNAVWLNAGIYDRPVASERAVHDMEHGAVWITYDPALPASQIVELRTFVHRQTVPGTTTVLHNRYIVMSPWDSADLPAPIVISSWGHQLRVSSPDDPRLQSFVDTFRTSRTYSPELGEPVDGVPIATGGRPFSD